MFHVSSTTEVPEYGIAFLFGVRAFVGAAVWVPFVIFLAVTYVRALGSAAADGITGTEQKLEDAAREIQFSHETRAAKVLRGLLQEEPDNPDAHALMGEVQLRRGEYELALGSLRLAMAGARSNEEFAKRVFKAAVILNEHLGDPKAAARELDLLRKRMPGTPEAEKAQDWIVRLMDEAAREE
jgi:predicted Zn-dependent protease